MDNNLLRLKSYLRGEMSESARIEFEAALRTDDALKKAAIQYALGGIPLPGVDHEIDELVQKVRDQTGPGSAPPRLSLAERIRYWMYGAGAIPIVALILLFVIGATALYVYRPLSSNQLITDYYIDPGCQEKAGKGDTATNQAYLLQAMAASNLCNTDREAGKKILLELAGKQDSFNIANYYLAHWYLYNRQFTEAIPAYEHCLKAQNQNTLSSKFGKDLNELKFNYLLAKMGHAPKPADILPELKAFLAAAPPKSVVFRRADKLRIALENPLRKIGWN
jgi:hypothetical protein